MAILAGIAIILKFALFPGGSILGTLSLMLLACFYFYLSFAFFNNVKLRNIFRGSSYKGISASRIIVSIVTGWGLSALCCGILFKIQHYPGGGIMLMAGLITIFIITTILLINYFYLPIKDYNTMIEVGIGIGLFCTWILLFILNGSGYIYNFFQGGLFMIFVVAIIALIRCVRSKSEFYIMILLRITVIGWLGLLLTFKSLDLTITKIQYRNHPDYVKAYEKYLDNIGNEEVRKQLEIEYNKTLMFHEELENQNKSIKNQK
jgi:hypothetical protein